MQIVIVKFLFSSGSMLLDVQKKEFSLVFKEWGRGCGDHSKIRLVMMICSCATGKERIERKLIIYLLGLTRFSFTYVKKIRGEYLVYANKLWLL